VFSHLKYIPVLYWLWVHGDFDDVFMVLESMLLNVMITFLLNLAPEPEPEPEPEMAEYQGSFLCG